MRTRKGGAISRAALAVPADVLAPRLLGQRLVRLLESGERLEGEIVEVEAYLGAPDRACHTFGGRRTERNEVMYAAAGTAYVYFTYGMHFCMNIVCGGTWQKEGDAGGGVGQAVLVRALRPIEGLDAMRRNRERRSRAALRERELCGGPARLCQALGIDRALNGQDMLVEGPLMLLPGEGVPARRIARAKRIGIESAGAWARRLLRWYVKDCEHVSVR